MLFLRVSVSLLARFQLKQKSPANAKGNARQRCMFEALVQTKSKLTDLSNWH